MEWISVKDRLPEIDHEVLIIYTIGKDDNEFNVYETARVDNVTEYSNGKVADWRRDGYSSVKPTHWMPLPEPPKK